MLETRILVTRNSFFGSPAKKIEQYFKVFAYGLMQPGVRAAMDPELSLEKQCDFLSTVCDQDMWIGSLQGSNMLLDQWERFTRSHHGLRVCMECLEISGTAENPIVTATGRNGAYITRDTIRNIFPHVLLNEPLVQKLVGAYIEYPFHLEFCFGDDGKIERFYPTLDFVAALTEVLSNVRDVTVLMEHAQIYDGGLFGDGASQRTLASNAKAQLDYILC